METKQVYAGFLTRFVAALIDGILVGFIFIVIAFALSGGSVNRVEQSTSLLQPLQWLLSVIYFVVYQAKTGQTIGKKAMHIKVVTLDGKTPTMLTFVLREIIGKLISAALLMIGYLFPLWDAKKQALHDKIASTVVIRVESSSVNTMPVQAV